MTLPVFDPTVRPELVEGRFFAGPVAEEKERRFDKLSANGFEVLRD
ncbi:hypothetical protein ACMGDH_07010 [Sphingomonas sp. DT-207]